jgi:uncharacterized protein YndB with AHSA1/START domain
VTVSETPVHLDAEPAADREVIITRVFDVPPRLLFLAYSRPDFVKQWFGPKGWPLTTCEMDFRVGGRFRFGMTGPDGQPGPPFGGEYLEIVPDKKIVYDNGFEGPDQQKMVVTVLYDEMADGKTALTIHTLFATVEMRNQHVGYGFVEGVGSGLDQLADLVADLAAKEAS